MLDRLTEWTEAYSSILTLTVVISILVALVYALLILFAIIRMRPDYFVVKEQLVKNQKEDFNVFRIIYRVLKNIFGLILILAGVLMLILPGQGVVTILIGITLIDFPKKQKYIKSLLLKPAIHQNLDKIRKKAGRSPIILPE